MGLLRAATVSKSILNTDCRMKGLKGLSKSYDATGSKVDRGCQPVSRLTTMSVTVGDVTVPADHCSPFVLRLAERLAAQSNVANLLSSRMGEQVDALKREVDDLKRENIRLMSREACLEREVAKLKKDNMRLFMGGSKAAEADAEATPAPSAITLFDEFAADNFAIEVGYEMCLTNAFRRFKTWVRDNDKVTKPMTRKMLTELMTKKFGQPVGSEGNIWVGVCFKENVEEDDEA